ncbi:hypothetical protein [Mucilaginibacter sp. BT774]|uniref:hypothetical protein n=1 Tax=Mucilaginibacter sp. BT774 TaxID=3062276 RepID=UPI002676B4B8|nr:hypothetical protein [Mucilaginibacter sp. BT774]MDO3627118.1 hypothetical protein [Mucilaginibacter sp. BT774]
MSKFVLEPFNDVIGKTKFYKIIEDTVCYWNLFAQRIEKESTWEIQIDKLRSIMNEVSQYGNDKSKIPGKKFKKLDPPGTDEFEVRTDDLRAYCILDKNGYIILYAGKNKEQDQDLNTFRGIKKRYLSAKENDITRKTT